jgi:hypothetical protein
MARTGGRGVRPAQVCAALLAALGASDGRSRSRKRDQTPDRIGLGIKRELLERAVREDPPAAAFEEWLLDRCLEGAGVTGVGPMRAMAQEVLFEWRLARRPGAFRRWLARGAHSDDARPSRP